MNLLSNFNTLACGPASDDSFTFILLMFAFIIFCIVSAVCSLLG